MRTFRVIVAGNEYEVAIEEITEGASAPAARETAPAPKPAQPSAQPAPQASAPKAAPSPAAAAGEGAIIAPMPGTIIDVKVNQGDAVKLGDTLLILEAMKMQNEIKAPCDGIVTSIDVAKGTAVNAGMAMMVLG